MKKILSLLLLLILLTGCAEATQEISNSPAPTVTPTNTPLITPWFHSTPVPDPNATPIPTRVPFYKYYNYPDSYYDKEAWENITNYKFKSVSGVDEKKREDFATVEEFDAHVKAECLKKYNRVQAYLENNWQKIDALYIHCYIFFDAYGHTISDKIMDVVVADPDIVRDWVEAFRLCEMKERENFSTEVRGTGAGTHLLFCLNIDGELVECFVSGHWAVPYMGIASFMHPFSIDSKSQPYYDTLKDIDSRISDAVNMRIVEIYKDPINYPYFYE